jgi:hypothetical protein
MSHPRRLEWRNAPASSNSLLRLRRQAKKSASGFVRPLPRYGLRWDKPQPDAGHIPNPPRACIQHTSQHLHSELTYHIYNFRSYQLGHTSLRQQAKRAMQNDNSDQSKATSGLVETRARLGIPRKRLPAPSPSDSGSGGSGPSSQYQEKVAV